jgi:cytochrome c peroxidase
MLRAVPSLRYAYRAPDFSIGPEAADADSAPDLTALARSGSHDPRLAKVAGAATAQAMVPIGGQFWDGRANTLQDQAMGPLFNPAEMANRSVPLLAARLRRSPYAAQFGQLFGSAVLGDAARLVDEANFAIARYQIEDSLFHSYTSKYDYYLEGRAVLTATEARGLAAFEDKARGNCAACHVARPLADGTPPAFTDYEYEALGVPRNDSISANREQAFFDLGLCGPVRSDLIAQSQLCGMFRTPSLRNVATRAVFFHNGRYASLDSVLAFYNFRVTVPDRVYATAAGVAAYRYRDLPPTYRSNIDTSDAPFDRTPGEAAPLTDQEMHDIVVFLGTLTDGYRPPSQRPGERPR